MPEPGEAGMYTNKIHYLRKYLLDELVTKKFAMDFMEPVDTAILQVPNYYTVIKRPMDVGTIIKRVQNRYYHRVDDLISDFQLVISNCFTFNRPGDVVYRNCQKLEKFFHRVLNKMPKGEEKPSTKDPRAPGRQHGYEKASEIVQRQCQEHLAKLHIAISKEDDPSICKYFRAKFDCLSQKVDRFYFKTIEEFRFEVTGIFKNFDNHIRTFHELFHRTCDQDTQQYLASCKWSRELDGNKSAAAADSTLKMDKRDITEVLHALKRAESSVEHCLKSYTKDKANRAKGLINAFEATADKLKAKLSTGRKVETTRDDRRREAQIFYNKLPDESSEEQSSEQSDDEDEPMEEENPAVQVFKNDCASMDADSDSDADANGDGERDGDRDRDRNTGANADEESDADSDAGAEADADPDDESVSDADDESDADAKAAAAVGADANANAVKAVDAEEDEESDSETDVESSTDTDDESDAAAGAAAVVETNANAVAETDANAVKDLDAAAGAAAAAIPTPAPTPTSNEAALKTMNSTLWSDLQLTSSEDSEDSAGSAESN
ncbi:PREDICTED: serine-aspartate repeat-containing protein D-like isoform X2 [Drosophila arizonae]|nr:PREDICTED: serine-aspartate repeat-containing protein D-like isoform X2 [Drosophila arizonae]